MSIDKLVVLITGILGMAFVYWFFLMKKEESVVAKESIDIKVEGGYKPDVIIVPKNKTTKINFLRQDPSACLEEVVLGDFKIRKFLPLNEKVTIEVSPNKTGEFVFSCGMNMFHGKLKVVGGS